MNRQILYLNRHLKSLVSDSRNLRFFALVGVAAAIMQLADELVDASALETTAFWVARLGGILGSLFLAAWLVDRWLVGRLESPKWLKPAVIVMLVAIFPLTVIEMAMETWVPQTQSHDDSELRDISMVLAFVSEYVTFASLLVPVNFLLWLLIDARPSRSEAPEPVARVEPTFLGKSRGIKAADVIAMAAEEHYVRVITETTDELVHHRLGDAVEEMPGELGTRVHRSWWVADRHVCGARRGDRRWKLLLSNGAWVPVSDSYVQVARDRGYLKQRA